MRLVAFRIFNFRSIVDTGWQNISPDNITCLIGQNESGKTSVLESLQVFHTGIINEDVLRSDMSLPKVCCRFEIPGESLIEGLYNAENELISRVKGVKSVSLERIWRADLSSELHVGGEIKEYFDQLVEKKTGRVGEVEKKLMAKEHDIDVLLDKIKNIESGIKSLEADMPPDKKVSGFKFFRKKEKEANTDEEKVIKEMQKRLVGLRGEDDQYLKELDSKKLLYDELESLNEMKASLSEVESKLAETIIRLEERHQTMTLLSGPTLQELSIGEWESVLNDYKTETDLLEKLKNEIEKQILICGFVSDGNSTETALANAEGQLAKYSSEYSSESVAELFADTLPVFEIFEDFGSLLPNRIDLEDIIAENAQVEGYKAARNFLTIAQLDYSFFQQPSARILKQKIENLNSRLTLDFQDFWQQYVGRKNKIRISFELDHYSTSHGEKAGKPYLEFWVKDEGERLYPKQRSRGVRWFLSFYLELMAASVRKKKHLILLVDEPGVSLHARAQEDVLKVFEDIKDNIQVIYTTHSPHLVDIDKLHRVLAIQRDDVENQRSATTILDPISLVNASPDTLSPLQSIMGNPVGNQEFSIDKFNIIVNDVGTFYLLTAALKLIGYKGRIHFIPSTEPSSIPLMCNILMGWGMSFAVLLFNNEAELEVSEQLKGLAFTDDLVQQDMIVVMPEGFMNAEDLLSTLDFKNHILHSREGITVSNSEYLIEKNLPRNFLLSKFLSNVKLELISRESFDEETRENLMLLLNILQKYK
ncbi:MAG: AAA family ATPase [Bacteroidales bacterium]|nr:AAA family ATPase [Bacteroidales bacterium]